jgi:hypothetical protein
VLFTSGAATIMGDMREEARTMRAIDGSQGRLAAIERELTALRASSKPLLQPATLSAAPQPTPTPPAPPAQPAPAAAQPVATVTQPQPAATPTGGNPKKGQPRGGAVAQPVVTATPPPPPAGGPTGTTATPALTQNQINDNALRALEALTVTGTTVATLKLPLRSISRDLEAVIVFKRMMNLHLNVDVNLYPPSPCAPCPWKTLMIGGCNLQNKSKQCLWCANEATWLPPFVGLVPAIRAASTDAQLLRIHTLP